MFSIEQYDFKFPQELIARFPIHPRSHSRLMILNRNTKRIEHRFFYELPEILNSDYFIVTNNSKVIRARLVGHRLTEQNNKRGGKIEFLLLEKLKPCVWEGMFHASVKHKPGVKFIIESPKKIQIEGEIIRGASHSFYGTVVARFNRDPLDDEVGDIPIPPYLKRKANVSDHENYQTIYANVPGSSAAPTAGFHFTKEVIDQLRQKRIGWAEITLHVGLGTFRPIKTSDIRKHNMHEEYFEISEETACQVMSEKKNNKKILAVGTTTVRALESAWNENNVKAGANRTSLYFYPGSPRSFQVVDALLTNFHFPKSTLLLLVCAFAEKDFVLSAYQEAIQKKYRLFSYGDAMLIL